jgi:mono/diheme cytochrome c family protein
MRCLLAGMLMLAAGGCTTREPESRKAESTVDTAVAFDGADYQNEAAKTAHGKRLATLFACAGCHGADYA